MDIQVMGKTRWSSNERDVSYDVVEGLSVWFCTAGSTNNSG